ncbi:hypothetical protein QOT17_013751 [Balamuthia mandrillaris]
MTCARPFGKQQEGRRALLKVNSKMCFRLLVLIAVTLWASALVQAGEVRNMGGAKERALELFLTEKGADLDQMKAKKLFEMVKAAYPEYQEKEQQVEKAERQAGLSFKQMYEKKMKSAAPEQKEDPMASLMRRHKERILAKRIKRAATTTTSDGVESSPLPNESGELRDSYQVLKEKLTEKETLPESLQNINLADLRSVKGQQEELKGLVAKIREDVYGSTKANIAPSSTHKAAHSNGEERKKKEEGKKKASPMDDMLSQLFQQAKEQEELTAKLMQQQQQKPRAR